MSMSDTILNIFTSKNKQKVKNIVDKTNELSQKYNSITTSQNKIKISVSPSGTPLFMTEEEFEFFKITVKLKSRLRNGETIEDIMPDAFAVCREATKRRLGMYHYNVQIEAASAMQYGSIVEMKTGEGKSLVQILSAYLSALEATCSANPKEHKSVHVITANEYLAERDWKENSKVFSLLGITSGYAMSQGKVNGNKELIEQKKKAYASTIVFATAPTIAFDYLEDNQVLKEESRFMRKPLHKAIVDEADDILLDQATKPLILSKSNLTDKEEQEDVYEWAVKFINGEPGYRKRPVICHIFDQYEKNKYDSYRADCALYLDNTFIDMENLSKEIYGNDKDLSDPQVAEELFIKQQAVMQCILAREFYKEGKQYQVFEDKSINDPNFTVMKVMLTDAFTGRSLEKTRYKNGIQEAIEATVNYNLQKKNKTSDTKYRLQFSTKNSTVAKCTYPDFLSIYESGVCGMTGTSDEEEFQNIYGLDTYVVSSRKPNMRIDEPDEIYATEEAKFKAIVREVLYCRRTMQPILIGTTSVEESNKLCKMLKKYGIRFQRLDAVNKDNENGIKETAGLLGSVTVATNMAGRGIDIKLGPGALEAGGLYVIGSSKNKNKRIDNQLRGRAARQGEPGKTKYFMSLDDELVRTRHNSSRIDKIKQQYLTGDQRIDVNMVNTLVNDCQDKEESLSKQKRKYLEEKEAKVFTKHKKIIYDQRVKILTSNDNELHDIINKMILSYVESLFAKNVEENEMIAKLSHLINVEECFDEDVNIYKQNIINKLNEKYLSIISSKTDNSKYYKSTRTKMLKVINDYWISHMETLDRNWTNATYYAYSNMDPMEIYERQSIIDLQNMTYYIQNEMLTYALNPQYSYGEYEIKETEINQEKEKVLI